jgi:hypothetical protein
MRNKKINFKQFVLLISLLLTTVWCMANGIQQMDGHSHINIKAGFVQGAPKSSTIQAAIDGHMLTVVFTENLGQVTIEITTTSGASVEYLWVHTPNGIQTYLPLNGDYIITFTLPNGDEYYGEFTVTD